MMQMRAAAKMGLIALVSVVFVGCAATPKVEKDAPVTVFEQPIAKVQKATVDALVVTGFDVKKSEPTYVEGFRPHKVGLAVGSGGETVGVWLAAKNPDVTEVKIDTAKSLVGIVGQRNWNADVLAEIKKSLGQ
ncbi:MAG: hypothetical protein M0P19_12845 [Nevskia sp.]|jgi:hypothetical protein|nr:hypothetical protein [Nevskia sp.]